MERDDPRHPLFTHWTVAEAAGRLGCTTQTVYNHLRGGGLEGYQHPQHGYVVSKSSVNRLWQKQMSEKHQVERSVAVQVPLRVPGGSRGSYPAVQGERRPNSWRHLRSVKNSVSPPGLGLCECRGRSSSLLRMSLRRWQASDPQMRLGLCKRLNVKRRNAGAV